MRMLFLRPLFALFALLLAAFGCAGTLNVTSPTNDDYLGKSNTLTFNLTGARVRTHVTAVATPTSGASSPFTFETDVTPTSDGSVDGTLGMNFSESAPQGTYTVVVSATEPGNTYSSTTLNVTVDAIAPKFLDLSPVNGGFTRSTIRIRASIEEVNLQDWRVQVNGQDIPNNTGEGNTISVDYDASALTSDGAQSISIRVRDKAKNETTKTVSVTLDRVRPVVQIVYPSSTTRLSAGSAVTVLIDITDASSTSVDKTGIDVIVKKTDGTYLTRVTFLTLRSTSGTTQRWTGRIRYQKGLLPSTFVISASVFDRTGNAATLQEVTAKYGR